MDPLRPPEPPPLGTTIPRPPADGTETGSDESNAGGGESRPVTADASAGRDPNASPLPDESELEHRTPVIEDESSVDDRSTELRASRLKTAPAAAQIDATEARIEAEQEQAETMFGVSNVVAAATFGGAAGIGTGIARGTDGINGGDREAGPDADGDDAGARPEAGRSMLEEQYDPALMRRVSGYPAEGDTGMPTIGRDQLNTGETVDPAFADAEAAASGAEAGAETDAAAETADAQKPLEDGAADATTDAPRMDDLVEDDQGTSGIRNRTDALLEADVELPDAARQHMGSPSGMRGDDPDAERFQAPRSWSDAGAEHAAEAASGAGDPGRGEGAGRPSTQTNGTSHPSDHAQDDDDGGTLRAEPALPTDDQGPGFEGSAGSEHGRGDEHGRDDDRGRGRGDRDAEEIETDA